MMRSEEPANCQLQLPVYENMFTSTDLEELLSFFQTEPNNNKRTSTHDQPVSSDSGSDEPKSGTSEERNEKRKISNRESARRSRWRKKTHLQNLTAQVIRLKSQNRDYRTRLNMILYQLYIVQKQNDQFKVESVGLLKRHSDLNRVLHSMQFQYQYKRRIIDGSSSLRFSVQDNGPFRSLRYAC